MGCEENFCLANNPDRPKWIRKEALCNLVRDGCIDYLAKLVNDSDRPTWLRYGALEAICAFACLGPSVSVRSTSISFGGHCLSMSSLSVDVSLVAPCAAEVLRKLANNADRPNRMREMAVETLVAGRWSQHCLAIADNPDRPKWMRRLAMKGL